MGGEGWAKGSGWTRAAASCVARAVATKEMGVAGWVGEAGVGAGAHPQMWAMGLPTHKYSSDGTCQDTTSGAHGHRRDGRCVRAEAQGQAGLWAPRAEAAKEWEDG